MDAVFIIVMDAVFIVVMDAVFIIVMDAVRSHYHHPKAFSSISHLP